MIDNQTPIYIYRSSNPNTFLAQQVNEIPPDLLLCESCHNIILCTNKPKCHDIIPEAVSEVVKFSLGSICS